MDVRPFNWRDLPALNRYRRHSVFLNTSLLLTRGQMMIPGALLSYIAPEMGVFTCVGSAEAGDDRKLIGQAIHHSGSQFSHLTFFTPEGALDSLALSGVVDYLVAISGKRGALRLLADVDERSQALEMLRRSSFATCTRQRVWKIVELPESGPGQRSWSVATERDAIAIGSLYHNLVPGMVQQVESFSIKNPQGMIYRQGDELLAYVALKYGHRGIWAQPFVHPDTPQVSDKLCDLVMNMPYRRSRPVYVCVRSYQSWLENALDEIGALAGPQQAVMVKHLAVRTKAVLSYEMPVVEGSQPEVTAPIVRSQGE